MRTWTKGDQVLLSSNFSNIKFSFLNINCVTWRQFKLISLFKTWCQDCKFGTDVLIGLFLYFHLLSLQNAIVYFFFQFLQVGVRLVSREAFLKHL